MDSLLSTMMILLFMGLHFIYGFPTSTADDQNLILLPETEPVDMAVETESSEPNLDEFSNFLIEFLIEDPWKTVGDPLIYVSEAMKDEEDTVPLPWKRSRFYGRYPWKRQNRRRNYDSDGFICNPSKDDLFQFLVALHESKSGKDRTVNFCNRRRPARAIFTNIRFLGSMK